jgi:hypothetical protein
MSVRVRLDIARLRPHVRFALVSRIEECVV